MKKTILLPVVLVIGLSGYSQTSNLKNKTVYERKVPTEILNDNRLVKIPNTYTSSHGSKAFYEEQVQGNTFYDLQTNASVQDRIMIDGDGNIATVWTGSKEENRAFPDRGTRYRYYNAATDSWSIKNDNQRIETLRCGWPNILFPASGGEVVISHQASSVGGTSNTKLRLNSRPTRGTGSWTEKLISNTDLTWPRAAMGGSDGNSIHLIALTNLPDSNRFQGLRRAVVYYRSKDGGSTFDIQDSLLSGLDASEVGNIGGDNYAIKAKGDTVIIAVFDTWNDVFFLKSLDNGDTWTKTVAFNHPFAGLDPARDTVTSLVACPDGSGSILLAADGTVHLFWGWYDAFNDATEAVDEATYSFIPVNSNGLLYWNDTKAANQIDTVAKAIDMDNNGSFGSTAGLPNYGVGITSMPSSGQGDDGAIYVTYSGVMETLDDLGSPAANYRHVFVVKSTDGGASWSPPHDINPNDEFTENVFASLYKKIDGQYLHILYQRDSDPGVSTADDPTSPQPITDNEIVYAKVDKVLKVGVESIISPLNQITLYPNPAKNSLSIDFNRVNPGKAQLTIVSITGQEILRMDQLVQNSSQNIIQLDISNYPSGIYFVSIIQEEGTVASEKLIIE